ncbi:MAG: hypothetical protein IKH88_08560 [Prevotella sp.]|nr:hypothetical protein [Prevotella sp.]
MGKVYSKPLMVLEQFTPQEFVSLCDIEITALPSETVGGSLRLDGFPANGKFDDGERASHHLIFAKPAYKLNPKYYEIVNMNVYRAYGHASTATESWEVGNEYMDGIGQYKDGSYFRYDLVTNQLIHYHYGSTDFYLMMNGEMGTQYNKNVS